jgi:hypothetical protein
MNRIPDRCSVALKEWAGICRALTDGRQTLLARKGGIAERDGRFVPDHPAFWLFPTHLHEAQQGLRGDAAPPDPPRSVGDVPIDSLALVQHVEYVRSERALTALEPFHAWTPETIRKRFDYRAPGLWILAVRVFRLPGSWRLVPTAEQLGCRSWVFLDEERPTHGLRPVLADAAAGDRLARLLDALAAFRGAGS